MFPNERYASIDIGTNTVKLIIVDTDVQGRFVPVYETSRGTRLGEGIHARRLREAAMRRTLDTLAEFALLCRQHGVSRVAAVGTSALRDAVNGEEFIERARQVGVEVEAISGEEEARLSFLAVRRDPLWRDARQLLVVDIGGGSTEIIVGDTLSRGVSSRISMQVGAVRLTEAALRSDPPSIQQIAEANRTAEETLTNLHLLPTTYMAVGVGGTLVNMAAVKTGLAEHDPERIHGTKLTLSDVEGQVGLYAQHSVEERRRIVGLDPARADIILGGAIILCQVLSKIPLDSITVSVRGLRWGVLYDRFGG